MTLLTAIEYGFYFLLFSLILGMGIYIVGFFVIELVKDYKKSKPPDSIKIDSRIFNSEEVAKKISARERKELF